jgi:hypothetical protein
MELYTLSMLFSYTPATVHVLNRAGLWVIEIVKSLQDPNLAFGLTISIAMAARYTVRSRQKSDQECPQGATGKLCY